jgi:hypothetical protein
MIRVGKLLRFGAFRLDRGSEALSVCAVSGNRRDCQITDSCGFDECELLKNSLRHRNERIESVTADQNPHIQLGTK